MKKPAIFDKFSNQPKGYLSFTVRSIADAEKFAAEISKKFKRTKFEEVTDETAIAIAFEAKGNTFGICIAVGNSNSCDLDKQIKTAASYITASQAKGGAAISGKKAPAKKEITDAQIEKANKEIQAQLDQFNQTTGKVTICDFYKTFENHTAPDKSKPNLYGAGIGTEFQAEIESNLFAARIKIRKAPAGSKVKIFYTKQWGNLKNNTLTFSVSSDKTARIFGKTIDLTNENLKAELGIDCKGVETSIRRIDITYPDALAESVQSTPPNSPGDYQVIISAKDNGRYTVGYLSYDFSGGIVFEKGNSKDIICDMKKRVEEYKKSGAAPARIIAVDAKFYEYTVYNYKVAGSDRDASININWWIENIDFIDFFKGSPDNRQGVYSVINRNMRCVDNGYYTLSFSTNFKDESNYCEELRAPEIDAAPEVNVESITDKTPAAEIGAQIQPVTDSVNADSAQPVNSDVTAESEIQPATEKTNLQLAIGETHYQELQNVLDASPNKLAVRFWRRFESKITVKSTDFKSRGRAAAYFMPEEGIYFNLADDASGNDYRKPFEILIHEGAHNTDYALESDFEEYRSKKFVSRENPLKYTLQEAAEVDAMNLFNKFERALKTNSTSDIAEKIKETFKANFKYTFKLFDLLSMTTTKRAGFDGHGKRDTSVYTEVFANFMNCAIANPEEYIALQTIFPITDAIFNEILADALGEKFNYTAPNFEIPLPAVVDTPAVQFEVGHEYSLITLRLICKYVDGVYTQIGGAGDEVGKIRIVSRTAQKLVAEFFDAKFNRWDFVCGRKSNQLTITLINNVETIRLIDSPNLCWADSIEPCATNVCWKCGGWKMADFEVTADRSPKSNADNDAQISGAQIVNSNEEANQMSNENSTTQITATTDNTPEINSDAGDKIIDAGKILAAAKALDAALNGNSSNKNAVIHAIQSKVASALGVDKTKAAVKIALNLPPGRETSDTDILNALKKLAGQPTTAAPVAPKADKSATDKPVAPKADKPATPKADKTATDKTPAPVATPPQIIDTNEIETIKKQIADGESYISMYRKMAENNSDTMRAEITKHIEKHEVALNQLRNKLAELAAPAPILWMKDADISTKARESTIEGQIIRYLSDIQHVSFNAPKVINKSIASQIDAARAAAGVETLQKIAAKNPGVEKDMFTAGSYYNFQSKLDRQLGDYKAACRDVSDFIQVYFKLIQGISDKIAALADLAQKYPQVVAGSEHISVDALNAALNYKIPALVGIEVDDTDNQPAPVNPTTDNTPAPEIDDTDKTAPVNPTDNTPAPEIDTTDNTPAPGNPTDETPATAEVKSVEVYVNPSDGVNVPFYTPSNCPIYTPSDFPFSFDNVIPATDDFHFSLDNVILPGELLAAVIENLLDSARARVMTILNGDTTVDIARRVAQTANFAESLSTTDNRFNRYLALASAGLTSYPDIAEDLHDIATSAADMIFYVSNTFAVDIPNVIGKITERVKSAQRYLGRIDEIIAACPAAAALTVDIRADFDAEFTAALDKIDSALALADAIKLPDIPTDNQPAPSGDAPAPVKPVIPSDNPSNTIILPAEKIKAIRAIRNAFESASDNTPVTFETTDGAAIRIRDNNYQSTVIHIKDNEPYLANAAGKIFAVKLGLAEYKNIVDAQNLSAIQIGNKRIVRSLPINPTDNTPENPTTDNQPAPDAPTSPIAPPDAPIDTNPSTVEITPANSAPTQSITPEIITAEPNPNAATNFDIQKFAAPDSAVYEVSGFAYGLNDNTNLVLFEILLIELHEKFGDDTGDGVGLSYQFSENREQNKIRFDVDADIVLSFNGIIPYEDYVRLCNCTPGVKVQMDANRTEIQPVAPTNIQPENDNTPAAIVDVGNRELTDEELDNIREQVEENTGATVVAICSEHDLTSSDFEGVTIIDTPDSDFDAQAIADIIKSVNSTAPAEKPASSDSTKKPDCRAIAECKKEFNDAFKLQGEQFGITARDILDNWKYCLRTVDEVADYNRAVERFNNRKWIKKNGLTRPLFDSNSYCL